MYESVCRGLQNRGRRAISETSRELDFEAMGKSGPYRATFPSPLPLNYKIPKRPFLAALRGSHEYSEVCPTLLYRNPPLAARKFVIFALRFTRHATRDTGARDTR